MCILLQWKGKADRASKHPQANCANAGQRIAAFGMASKFELIDSISRTTISGAAFCTMWPTPGSTINFAPAMTSASGLV
jgi:hypothetical protein